MTELYHLLFDQLEEKLRLLEKEIQSVRDDESRLLDIASSFLPPRVDPDTHPGIRNRRAVGILMAAAAAAGLVLGDPVKNAACSVLSMFNLCTDNRILEDSVNCIMDQQSFQETLQRVQTKTYEKFSMLGHELKATQESVQQINDAIGANLRLLQTDILKIEGVLARTWQCNLHIIHIIKNMYFSEEIRSYINHLDSLYTLVKSYRAAFYAYKIALFFTISSLAAGYVTPNFLLPAQLSQIVNELANDEILRGTKLSPDIRPGQEAIYYDIQRVLEVSLISRGVSVVLGIPMNSRSSSVNVYHATALHQPNDDGDTASIYQLTNPFLAISEDNTQFAELSCSTLQQCSGNNRIKLCRKGFSTTTDETLLCLPSLFYNSDNPSLRNCKVESVLLPDAPQAFYLAECRYHVISKNPNIQMKNDSRLAGFSISTLSCQACLIRPRCTSTLSFNQGDLVLSPDMEFCESKPEPLVASIELTPSLAQVFKHVPQIANKFHAYSVAEAARQSVISCVRLDLLNCWM